MSVIMVDVAKLFRLHADTNLTTAEVCDGLGITRNQLYALQKKYGLAKRSIEQTAQRRHDDPTPEEIAERAAWCRARRSADERRRDENRGRVRWNLPSYTYNGRDCSFSASVH